MGQRSKSAKSSISNLGSKSQKTIMTASEDIGTNDSVYELGPMPRANSEHINEVQKKGFSLKEMTDLLR
jgi:hypothetical protein